MAQPAETGRGKKDQIPQFVTDLLQTRESKERPFEGKVAFITGGNREIGGGITLLFALHGSSVVVMHRDGGKEQRSQPIFDAVQSCNVTSEFLVGDITNPADRASAAKTIETSFGGQLDFLVLNASGPTRETNVTGNNELVTALLPYMKKGSKIILMQSTPGHFSQSTQYTGIMPEGYGDVANAKYEGEQSLLARREELETLGITLIIATPPLAPETANARMFTHKDGTFREKNKALSATYGLPETVSIQEIGEKVVELATRDLPFGYVELFGSVYDARSALRSTHEDNDILVETIIDHGPVSDTQDANLWEGRYLVAPQDCQEGDRLSDKQLKEAAAQTLEAIAYYKGIPPASLNDLEYPEEPIRPGDILSILTLTEKDQNGTAAEVLIGKKPGLTKTASMILLQ